MKFIIVALAYSLIFVAVELMAKKFHPPGEVTRKLSHILAGIGAALLPFVLTFNEIALLGALLVPAVFISMKSGIFRSVHSVRRSTYGEVYFPLAIAVCALLFPDRLLYTYGVLVIGVSDALAGLLGQRYGRKSFGARHNKKTFFGSGVFFVTTAAIGMSLVVSFIDTSPWKAIVWSIMLAGILTIVEARATKGIDNLLVPVSAAGLLGFIELLGFFAH